MANGNIELTVKVDWKSQPEIFGWINLIVEHAAFSNGAFREICRYEGTEIV